MPTVREARRLAVQALSETGIETAGLDARLLLEGALDTRDLNPEHELDAATVATFEGFLHRRFFNDTATTKIYTILFVGSVRCV